MDPLTHTLTGAALANTRIAQRARLALPTLLIAVNLPDVDVFSHFAGGDAALGFRRGWTHGILAMAILPLLLAAVMGWIGRRFGRRAADGTAASFRTLLPLAYLGVLSHPLLDWLNTYGIRLLMPFDDRWFYGDALFIIDPWIWLTLGGAAFLSHSGSRRRLVAWAALAALATAIFMAGSAGHPGARIAWFAALVLLVALRAKSTMPRNRPQIARLATATLLAATLYVTLLLASSALARRNIEDRLPGLGIEATDVMVGPVPVRPLAHAVILETASGYHFAWYDWFSRPRLRLDPRVRPKPDWQDPRIAAAANAPCLRGMMGWLRYPWVEIESSADGHVVHVMDARYTRDRTTGFGGASVRLRPDLSDDCGLRER